MQRTQVDILYVDGTTASTVLRPATLVAAERHFAGRIPGIEGTLWAAHYQLCRGPGGNSDEKFADWLDRVDAVEEVSAVPTSAAPSAPPPTSP